jgi:hypothetical protein
MRKESLSNRERRLSGRSHCRFSASSALSAVIKSITFFTAKRAEDAENGRERVQRKWVV